MERIEGRPSEHDCSNVMGRGLCMMAVMDTTGDHRLTWDPLDPTDVEKAREEFKRLKKAGYMAYRLNLLDDAIRGPQASTFSRWDGELIMEFDELPKDRPSEVVMSPMMAGG